MGSIVLAWPMLAAASLTLAAIHLASWLRARRSWANLLFAVTAAAGAAHGVLALLVMRAHSIEEAGEAQRWLQVPACVAAVSLAWFVYLYFGAGRRWLAWAVTGLRAVVLALNFALSPNILYREITDLRRVSILGEVVSVPVGVPHPWAGLAGLSSVLFLAFVLEASRTVWLRGERARALSVGLPVALGSLIVATLSPPILLAGVAGPPFVSLVFLTMLVVIGSGISGDMARSARLSEELRASEKRLLELTERERDSFFNLPLDLISIVSADGLVRRVNPACGLALGWSDDEMVGRPVADFVHPQDSLVTRRRVGAVIEGQTIEPADVRVLCKDGGWRTLSWKAARLQDGSVYATGRDVTEARAAEALVRARHEQTETFGRALLLLRDRTGDDLDTFFPVATAAVARAMRVSRVSVWLYSADEAAIECVDLCSADSGTHERGQRLAAADFPAYFHAIESDDLLIASDARSHPATRELADVYLQPRGIVSMLDAPLVTGSGRLGVMCFEHASGKRPWTEEEQEFARTAASYVTLAIEQAGRRRAVAALHRSEQRHRRLFEGSRDAIMTLEPPRWRFTSCNPAAIALFGVADEPTFCTLDFRDLSPELQPDGQPSEQRVQWMLERAMETGSHAFEWTHWYVDGRPFPATVLLSRIEHDGKMFLQATVRDVSEQWEAEDALRAMNENLERLVTERTGQLRASEERHRAIVGSLNEGLVLTDLDDVITDVNFRMLEMTGYRRDELIGRRGYEVLLPPEDFERMRQRNLRRAAGASEHYEQRHRRKDGTEFWALVAGSPLHDGRGQVIGTVGVILDITERKHAERVALRSQRVEAIGLLAGGIAHDMNNALSPIVMALDRLRELYPGSSRLMDLCDSSAGRAIEMVRHLLAFARGAQGEHIPLPVDRSMKEIERLVRSTFPKNISLALERPAEPLAILGDATQIHQMLLNLCVNARDAMPAGGTLTLAAERVDVGDDLVSAEPVAVAGRYVMFSVRDTGSGIVPEVLDRMFEPFFTTKGPHEGTGLGLSTVAGIVKGHGGFLRVSSSPGQGSAFMVYLPEQVAQVDDPRHAGPAEFRGRGETILLVDDEVGVLETARIVLERLNLTVVVATDGQAGVARAMEHRASLRAIVTDVQMPCADGVVFARNIRGLLPDVPLAVMTGHMDDGQQKELERLGVLAWLAKPFTQAQLVEATKTLLAASLPTRA